MLTQAFLIDNGFILKDQKRSAKPYVSFTSPQKLYFGTLSGQTVVIDYSSKISGDAKRIELLNQFSQEYCGTPKSGWVKVSNQLDFHFNRIVCHSASSGASDTYSQSYVFPVTQDKKIYLEVSQNWGRGNIGIYLSGYYSY